MVVAASTFITSAGLVSVQPRPLRPATRTQRAITKPGQLFCVPAVRSGVAARRTSTVMAAGEFIINKWQFKILLLKLSILHPLTALSLFIQ